MVTQLSILEPKDAQASLARVHAEAARLRTALPPDLHFGCEGYTGTAWVGEVFSEARRPFELAKDGLREYARHPLLDAVLHHLDDDTNDLARDLQKLGREMPEGFGCLVEAPLTFTTPRRGGASNPHFLDAKAFAALVVWPCVRALGAHLAALCLRFPSFSGSGVDAEHFAQRLDAFFQALPEGVPYAVELTDLDLLSLPLARTFAQRGVSPILSTRTGPLTLLAQALPSGPRLIVRALASESDEVAAFLAEAPDVPRYVILADDSVPAPRALRRLAATLLDRPS